MHKYFIKTPRWVPLLFPAYVWRLPASDKTVYLTFDDGPHPTITPWVLSQLDQFNAKATFFCIGDNVVRYPDVYDQILEKGHSVGNHTQHHCNGWKTSTERYVADVVQASEYISSSLFRPPYGKIKSSQARGIKQHLGKDTRIVMWDVLSADFDKSVSSDQCTANVLKNVQAGSVVVFHDSEKAFRLLERTLPEVLRTLRSEGYNFKKISMDSL